MRSGDRIVEAGEGEGEGGIRQHMSGKAAVSRIAGEERIVAEVLPIGDAVGTAAAGAPQPWNADACAERSMGDPIPDCLDDTDNLVPGTMGSFGLGSSPSTTCKSVRQTAQASTRTKTSPDPGRRVGRRSSSFSGLPISCKTIIFMNDRQALRAASNHCFHPSYANSDALLGTLNMVPTDFANDPHL